MNIAEILKYCPKGTELYSTIWGEVELNEVTNFGTIEIKTIDQIICASFALDYEGRYSHMGECVLFPSKDQRDWDEFRLPVKRGDVMMEVNGKYTFIANGKFDEHNWPIHICGVNGYGFLLINNKEEDFGWTANSYIPALEEAKKKLFDKMTEAGYRWNTDTLELEKIKPKFKEGDVVIDKNNNLYLVSSIDSGFIYTKITLYANGKLDINNNLIGYFNSTVTLASKEEKNKLLSILVKEGYKYDKKQHKLIKQESKPFEKVLVRDDINEKWSINIFSYYDEEKEDFPYICLSGCYLYCIPYEGNEYLLGTTDSPTCTDKKE